MCLLFCMFPYYFSLCLCFQKLAFRSITPHQQKTPWSSACPSLVGSRSPRHTIEVLTTYLLQFFYLLFILCFVLFYIGIFTLTNTVRTKVAKTAKSELRFCLFVILLLLLPQWVSIRNEDLQINPDCINCNKRP